MGQGVTQGDTPLGPETEIIFSSADGYVWATWPDSGRSARLGTSEAVTAMMTDFLAQCALGDRLTRKNGAIGHEP